MNNKIILENANKAIIAGEHEIFLNYLSDDATWNFVGDRVISGKKQISLYINEKYTKPPRFDVEKMIAEGDHVTAFGRISLLNESNKWTEYHYCDIWSFRDGKMDELKAFVIPL